MIKYDKIILSEQSYIVDLIYILEERLEKIRTAFRSDSYAVDNASLFLYLAAF